MNGHWVREPLKTYANYSPELVFGWLLGIPLLSAIIILTLVRQLNRPLRRLQEAANTYSQTGKAPYLETNHGPLEIRQVNQAFNQMILPWNRPSVTAGLCWPEFRMTCARL